MRNCVVFLLAGVKVFANRVILAVESGPEWTSFSARQRLLTCHFAFLEEALNWRSLMLSRFGAISPLARPAWMRAFETRFKAFASAIVAKGAESGEIAERGRLNRFIRRRYLRLRSAIDFYLNDDRLLTQPTLRKKAHHGLAAQLHARGTRARVGETRRQTLDWL